MTNKFFSGKIRRYLVLTHFYGGIAQLARASGSYPAGHRFKSHFRHHYGPLVKRLRHGPFTAVTWVRFPYGSPAKRKHSDWSAFFVLLRLCTNRPISKFACKFGLGDVCECCQWQMKRAIRSGSRPRRGANLFA